MASQIEVEDLWWKSEIIPKLLKEKKILTDLNSVENVQIANINIQLIGAEEAFMLTKCYRICVTFKYPGGGGVKEIHFFVKKTPQVPQEFFDSFSFMALFSNEIAAYEHIIPAFESIGNFKLNTAKFYYAELKPNSATVITEDFGSHKWRVTKDRYNLSLDHTLMAIRYLAKFHAAGFALRSRDRTQFEKLTQPLMETRFASDYTHPKFVLKMKCAKDRFVKATREYAKEVPDTFVEQLGDLLDNVLEFSRNLVQPREPFITLCHGDYLRNNVAYRYDGDKPTDIMMFDLQTLRVSSPMVDLTTFLMLSTLAEVRHSHFREIFQTYCDQLKESYEKFAQQPLPDYLSFQPLLKEYIKFLPYCLGISSWFLYEIVEPMTMTTEEMLNMESSDEENIADWMSRGGEIVDRELAHQAKELWQLSEEHKVEVFTIVKNGL